MRNMIRPGRTMLENTFGDVRDLESNFTPVKRVLDAMKGLIEEFHKDMEQAEKDGALDPYTLAAKYSARFLCIHPF